MTIPKKLLAVLAFLSVLAGAAVLRIARSAEDRGAAAGALESREAVAAAPDSGAPRLAALAPEADDAAEPLEIATPEGEPADPFTFDEPAPEAPPASGTIVLTLHDPVAFRDPGERRGGFSIAEDREWQAWPAEWPSSSRPDAPAFGGDEPRPEPREAGIEDAAGIEAAGAGPARRGPPRGMGPSPGAGRGPGAMAPPAGGGGRGRSGGGGGCSR